MIEERSMSDRLKVRLIGAVALLLIGVVGWFWLLDVDNPIEPVAQESAIPPAPAIQPFTVPQPSAPADIQPVGSERDATALQEELNQESFPAPQSAPVQRVPAVPEAAKPKPAPKVAAPRKVESSPAEKPVAQKMPAEKFEMDSNSLPVAWVVQVGAMATQASADKLKEQLIGKGFKAFTQSTKLPNGNTAIKVYVGPKLSRERADAQKKAIDAALKTNTMVVRFPPA
ncbi:MAG: SPOR domain-containing protein [Spongiibacteraceae bacterium]